MRTITSIAEMRKFCAEARRKGLRIALVPTMGFLHEGHLSLVRIGKQACDVVVVSSYVNPIQFGQGEDLAAYPRDFERDRQFCEREGVDVLFCPESAEMYAADYSTHVEESKLSQGLCGKARPGHFRGVATVVAKLFNIVQPDAAVFGQKDAQQVRVVQRMVRDLCFPVSIIVAPTVREADGLAMSSRNTYLSPDERKQALCLRRALDRALALCADGERDAARIKDEMVRTIRAATGSQIDYVEIVDAENLAPVSRLERAALALLAVRIGRTRLIDNDFLRVSGGQHGPGRQPLP